MKKRSVIHLLVLGLFAALLFHPNPYGNQPNAFYDESVFLISALSTLAHHAVPGWDFSAGFAYYGVITVYLVTILTALSALALRLKFGSTTLAQVWIALHTGDLMQIVRLSNALVLFAGVALVVLFLRRRHKEGGLDGPFLLLFGLLLGSSLFVSLAETGKVWIIQLTLEIAAASLVFLQERARREGREWMKASKYAAALLWLTFLAFLQNLPGMLTGIWILYALFLGHLKWKDVLAALKRWWLPMALILGATLPFFTTFIEVMTGGKQQLTTAAKAAFTRPDGGIDWAMQVVWPIKILWRSQPLLLPMLIGLFVLAMARRRLSLAAGHRWSAVLLFHPLFTLAAYHLGLRFGSSLRYVLPITVACAVTVAFLPKPKRLERWLLTAGWIAAVLVAGKTIWLNWRPSSELALERFFRARHDDPEQAIMIQDPNLFMPFNAASLARMSPPMNDLKRVQFLKAHAEAIASIETFKPLTLYGAPADLASRDADAIAGAAGVWRIDADCDDPCTDAETAAGSCVPFNAVRCVTGPIYTHEGGDLYDDLFAERQLGRAYFARQLK